MQYRIKIIKNDLMPFLVQGKKENSFLPFWRKVSAYKFQHEAENTIRRIVEIRSKMDIGDVIYEYCEADYVIDRLKNQRSSEDTSNQEMGGIGAGQVQVRSSAPKNVNNVKLK